MEGDEESEVVEVEPTKLDKKMFNAYVGEAKEAEEAGNLRLALEAYSKAQAIIPREQVFYFCDALPSII